MPRPRAHGAIAITAVAGVLLTAYALLWVTVTRTDVGISDFTATYVGGALLRTGHAASMYQPALEAPLHAALIAPLRRGNLPFVNPPAAAAIAAPLTLLPLDAAYRVWQALQLLLLAVAIAIAVRAAPWPVPAPRAARLAVFLAALAGVGTLSLGLLGQWDGVSALGLALAYAGWRRGHGLAGGLALGFTAAVAKPHLAIGLAGLLLGWRDRRVITGAALGVAGALLLSLAVAGTGGLAGFASAVRDDAGRWPLASMLGFTGITGSWLGDGAGAQAIAAAATAAACVACLVVGARLRTGAIPLEPALASATALSLVASPHLLGHDLVLMAPALVALLGGAAAHERSVAWPGTRTRAVLAGWLALNVAAALDLGSSSHAPPGRIVPWVLLVIAVPTLRQAVRGHRRPLPLLTAPA